MAISSHRISESTNNNNNNKVIHHQWSHSRNNNKDFIDYKYIDSLSPCYSYHASQVGTQSTRREIDLINKRLHHSIGAEGILWSAQIICFIPLYWLSVIKMDIVQKDSDGRFTKNDRQVNHWRSSYLTWRQGDPLICALSLRDRPRKL